MKDYVRGMVLDPIVCRQAILAKDARFDGRFFTGVTSTGIYCRPVCPARPPKAENCRYYPTAAAAQAAGFRPCLRCRPETAPGQGAWRGASNTVSRGMALIDSGAMDEAGVDKLADRLGVGERQLRRLFLRHLGASPIAVAQTRRVLIAKQLIHETDLPMAEIALAAGFGSVRRFNETMRALFGRAPTELRRSLGRGASAEAGITLSLGFRPPFDWDAVLQFLVLRAIPGVERIEDGVYRRSIDMDGAAGTLAVAHQPERNRLRVTIRFPQLAALPRIIARVRQMFDLDADPEAIGQALSRDRRLAPLVAARPGLRTPGAWDGFELAVRAILGQQITVTAATKLAGAIAARWGEPIEMDGLTRLFPRAEALATAVIAGMPGSRAASISRLAERVGAEPGLFERGPDLAATISKLRALPGIGEWTAHYIAMRALREPDAFPAADIGLMRAMDDGHGRPSPAQLLDDSQAWRPWRAYAALHLWTAPNLKETSRAIAA
ncbi:MAG TPA: AlkA N-terminal domain-containing protein [Caulobacteraceae bacterium]|jgi:AraC family transcriptional regulator of adaptative response / DNA-3-methyladenine glycosylase II